MYNPLPLLNENLLAAKIAAGKRYFVRQTYPRGMQPRLRACFLFRAYDESEEELAKEHLKYLSKDPNAFLYDADDVNHLARMKEAAKQPFGFKIFYAGKKGLDSGTAKRLSGKNEKVYQADAPELEDKKDGDKIAIGLYEEFGELFLKFSFGKQHDKIPFDEIEKY